MLVSASFWLLFVYTLDRPTIRESIDRSQQTVNRICGALLLLLGILVAMGCLLVVPQVVAAQSDTTGLGLRLGFGQPALQLQQPAVLRAPWMGAPRSTPALRLDTSL